jgi:hypothetical protein
MGSNICYIKSNEHSSIRMSFLRTISRLRTFSFPSRRQMSYNCSEDNNILSTTFKVNFCILLSTSIICNRITQIAHVLHEDKKELEEQLNKTIKEQFRK